MCVFSIIGSQQFGNINLQGETYKKKIEEKTQKRYIIFFFNYLIPFLIFHTIPFPFGFLSWKHD